MAYKFLSGATVTEQDWRTAQSERKKPKKLTAQDYEPQRKIAAETQRKAQEKARAEQDKKNNSLFGKVKSAAKAVGEGIAEAPTYIGRGLGQVGPAQSNARKAEQAAQDSNNAIIARTAKKLQDKNTSTEEKKRYTSLLSKIKKSSNELNAQISTRQKEFMADTDPLKQGAAVASVGFDIATAGVGAAAGQTIKQAAKQGVKPLLKVTAKNVAKSGVVAAPSGALSPVIEKGKDATAGDIIKGAGTAFAIGGAVPIVSAGGHSLLKGKAPKTEPLPATKTLSEPTPQPGDVMQPSLEPDTQKALDTVMAGARPAPDVTRAAQAAEQATQQAAKQADEVQKAATKATEQVKKIDDKIDLIKAKQKDAEDGKLSNVDQTKLKQLEAQKAELTPVAEQGSAVPEVKRQQPVTPKSESKPQVSTPKPSEPLKPFETAHMPTVDGYTHSTHMETDFADMLRETEAGLKGGQTIKNSDGTYRRTSEHSKFYRDYYKEFGRAPNKQAWLEEARRQLASGKAMYGASDSYKQLLERENRPIPTMEVKTTQKQPTKPVEHKPGNSRVYERLQAEHPELDGKVTYTPIRLKEEADKAAKLIASDKQKAYRIATGMETSDEITSTATNIALAEKALSEGNTKLYADLTRNRSLAQTRRGQEIVSEKASVTDNSASRYVKELINMRLNKLAKDYTTGISKIDTTLVKSQSKKATDVIDKEVAKAQKQIKTKQFDLESAQKLIDSLAC